MQADTWPISSSPSGLFMRQEVNKNFDAAATLHKGPTPPAYASGNAGFQWLDDSADPVWTLRAFKGGDVGELANWGAVWSYNRTTGNYSIAGNGGIGATPPTWSAFKALSLGSPGNFIAGSTGTTLALGVNAYYDGADWRRVQASTASTKFLADSTTFLWSFAAAGAAGGVATFADRMRLTQNSFGGGMLDIYGAAGVLAIRLDTSGTITSTGTYSVTTSNAANMYVHSDGSFNRSTSSLRFKEVLEPVADEWAYKLLDADGIFYKSLCAADNPDWTYYGFGAETIAQIDPRWVFWKTTDDAGEPLAEPVADGVQYERMVVALQHIAKREKARADAAEARLNAIEARLTALEAA